MPPWVSRKRSASPAPTPPAKKQAVAKNRVKPVKREKPTLFDAADELEKPSSTEKKKKFLSKPDEVDDESSLSEADSDDFEDVPAAKRRKTDAAKNEDDQSDEDDDDEGMDWEDAIQQEASTSKIDHEPEIGDVSISMKDDGSYIEPEVNLATGKKGPSKRERQVRVQTHCLHVQALMWHNTVRNSWLNDKTVQKTLVDGLTDGVKREVTRWREAMGMLTKEELIARKKAAAAKHTKKGKGRKSKDSAIGRDWSYNADHIEVGAIDLSHGDPLLRLLKVLTAYWRKRFIVTAPALRKQGYKPLRRLRDEIKAWDKNRDDAEDYGERIHTLAEFRKLAKECEGSRDVGGQLFVALLRGLGLETRMVANLQPAGFGWSKVEDAAPRRAKGKDNKVEIVEDDPESDVKTKKKLPAPKLKNALTPQQAKKEGKGESATRKSSRGNKAEPIALDDSDSPLSSPDEEVAQDDDDDMSVVDVTPATRKRPSKKYDRDMAFPNYWTEVMSPVSKKYVPVDPIVLSTIASTDDLLQSFEPRGKKAEVAKQVMCYTIAFSADGTAKDVTVRYLKRHQLPGKTKGVRMPVEKVPVHNRKGKVTRYEEYDWFRTVISLYDRPEKNRTAADDLEDQTDLKPFKAGKEAKEVEKESLQWYKQSAEFVLEQHLRREEAIVPGAEPVKYFTAGKGDKAKEYPVFRRDDVVTCKTVESWHKEGRAIKEGEHPFKHVPMRAVTLIRKREMEDALRETGEKLTQGLYSIDQTDWIIPPPIENGVIPKNAFGNMDVYVPTMVPKGAVHLPLKGSAKLCRRLQIDYAEACTGFEFGKQRAVPVLTGVVVAKEHEGIVRDAWQTEQAELKRKEDTKRTGVSLHWWRKMLMGLRIVERMKVDYAEAGGSGQEVNPFVNKAIREGRRKAESNAYTLADEEEMAGGFFRPGHEEEEVPKRSAAKENNDDDGGFFQDYDDDEDHDGGFLVQNRNDDQGGGFIVEDDADATTTKPNGHTSLAPMSLQAMHKASNGTTHKSDESDAGEDSDDEPLVPRGSAPRAKAGPKSRRQPIAKAEPTPKARAMSKAKPKTKVKTKQVVLSGREEASLSDLSDVSSDIANVSTRRASSPQVIVTPLKSTPASKGRLSVNGGRGRRRKTTPLKSPYFSSQGAEEDAGERDDGDEDGDEGSDESEVEVVKPRATTARTRGRR